MHNDILKRKEKIIITAIDLFNEAGINGLTTKEIARRQNITEPAIYKQFDSKKDILMAILERCASFDELIKNTIIDNKMVGKEGILYFSRVYGEYYQNYPQITTAMFSFDMFRYDVDLLEKMNHIVNERLKVIFDLVTNGSENQEFSTGIDKQALADTLFGVIWSTTFIWQMGGCIFNLKDRIIKAVEMILDC
ncbi:TetR/AcrR family transcriptional regulator [Pelosinus sp. sgz500959]|uniref:TetR/AcrR family transcriptional regulator n=1 Tax=Pelosinus sp. sgz500959 TaxID=3242472 RepID=UPI00366F0CE1